MQLVNLVRQSLQLRLVTVIVLALQLPATGVHLLKLILIISQIRLQNSLNLLKNFLLIYIRHLMGLLIAFNLHLPKLIIPLFVLLPPALNILNETIPRLQHRTIELTLTHNLSAKLKHTHLQIEQSKVNTILVVLVVKQRNTALTVNYPQLHTTTLS